LHSFVHHRAKKYPVNLLCEVLEVNESGYYRKLRNSEKQKKSPLLSVEVEKIMNEHEDNKNYGVLRVMTALNQRGISSSKRTIYRVMESLGYIHKRHIPHGITKATTEQQERENLIKRDFSSNEPNSKYLTDITEVACMDGKLYVSPVMDCFNGEIVALEMRDNMKKELCIATINKLKKAKKGKTVILHSDRGSQYTSEAFRKALQKKGFTQSLSGTGHCYDNSRMESFFATLKKEKLYQLPLYKMTRAEVMSIIFRYIFGYYNTQRVNSFNPDGLPPIAYRKMYNKQGPSVGKAA
jgi:transposase InsO family protein